MRSHFKWIYLLICFLTLTGCASLTGKPQQSAAQKESLSWENHADLLNRMQKWDLKGLIALRSAQEGWSANWQWQQNQKNYIMVLFGPLGSHSIQLSGSPQSVLLETSDGKKLTAASPESLLQQQLGWRLPVSSLYYWVRGLPVPGIEAQKKLDASHHLKVLLQQGWRIEYLRYITANNVDLPGKIILNNSNLTVKIIINQWNIENTKR